MYFLYNNAMFILDKFISSMLNFLLPIKKKKLIIKRIIWR